jgi:hypothetical protein
MRIPSLTTLAPRRLLYLRCRRKVILGFALLALLWLFRCTRGPAHRLYIFSPLPQRSEPLYSPFRALYKVCDVRGRYNSKIEGCGVVITEIVPKEL